MNKRTLFGTLLSKVQNARWQAKEEAARNLLKRNKLDSPADRDGFRIMEHSVLSQDGTESTEIRLWKLIDKEIVTIKSDVTTDFVAGLERGDLTRQRRDRTKAEDSWD